ncbi:uncharacterized protein [Choristoneura fumiferana]|uniref:uncharacterized protein n=1 Tax=Choristoneura fumiferana TaxID=7141 RepID=UPI003D1551C9
MDKQEVKRSSKTRLWLSARRKKKGPARHKKENINPNSTLGTGEHASEQSDSDNNTDPPPQPLNLSSTLGTGEHASEQSDSDNNTDPPPQFQNFSRLVDALGHHGFVPEECGPLLETPLNDIIRRYLPTSIPALLEPSGIARDDGKRPDVDLTDCH